MSFHNADNTRKLGEKSDERALPYNLLDSNSLNVSRDYVYFANLNLDSSALESTLAPFMNLVSDRISFTYKTPTEISFKGISGIFKLRLSDWMQFDEVCIKLLHVTTGCDVLVTLNTQVARSLLIRLLSTTLVDDSHGVLFSSTEKGIFSFIIARLLFELKRTLGDDMPDLKLIGIYHCQDESINETAIADHGVFNFSFSLAHDCYPVAIALPMAIFTTIKRSDGDCDLVKRCGHITAPMTFAVKTLSLTKKSIANLSFGDLIIFDHAECTFGNGRLNGQLRGVWQNIALTGACQLRGDGYVFLPNLDRGFTPHEEHQMENVEVAGAVDTSSENERSSRTIADLAKSIRVPLSIELARIPISLKELCQIREGQIIDLRRKINDPLDLVVEGKVIGYCQPVQIDGRLGIRVLSIEGNEHEDMGSASDISSAA